MTVASKKSYFWYFVEAIIVAVDKFSAKKKDTA